jgi:hypothetical protein
MVSSTIFRSWIAIGVTALTLATRLAEASGAEISPISQDRSVDVAVHHFLWECSIPPNAPLKCIYPVILTDEMLTDGQVASDFGPFSANASVTVDATNSRATQQSAISAEALSASESSS